MDGVRKYVIATLALLFLALGLPAIFYIGLDADQFSLAMGLNGLIIIYSAVKLSLPLARNQQRLMEMTFWLFTYIFMGIIPLVQMFKQQYPWAGIYKEETLLSCQLILLIGVVSYDIGIRVSRSQSRQSHIAGRGKIYSMSEPRLLSVKGFYLMIAVLVGLSVFLLVQTGGLESLFVPRMDVISAYSAKSQNLILNQLIKVPPFVCMLIGICVWKLKGWKSQGPRWMTIFLIVYILVLSNPISTPRYWFGSVLLTLVMILVPWRKGTLLFWTSSYLVLFLVLFPYTDLFRSELNVKLERAQITDVMAEKGDYDAYQMLLNTHQYVEENGIAYGNQLLGALFFWIPRSLWDGKPVGSGQFVAESLGYRFTNLSSPLWAESYINFGYIGVIMIFGLYGFVSGRLQVKFIAGRAEGTFTLYHFLVPFLSAYQFFLLRGDLMNGIAYLATFLVFGFLLTLRLIPSIQSSNNNRRSLDLPRSYS